LPNFIEYKKPQPISRESYRLLVQKICIPDVFTAEIAETPAPAEISEILAYAEIPNTTAHAEIPEVAAHAEIPETPQITLPEIPNVTPAPLDPATLSEELDRIIEEIEKGETPGAVGENYSIIKPPLLDNSGLNTPEFSHSPISYESLDVTQDITDWEDSDDDVIETMDTSENYL
jgi:hypothetical protein